MNSCSVRKTPEAPICKRESHLIKCAVLPAGAILGRVVELEASRLRALVSIFAFELSRYLINAIIRLNRGCCSIQTMRSNCLKSRFSSKNSNRSFLSCLMNYVPGLTAEPVLARVLNEVCERVYLGRASKRWLPFSSLSPSRVFLFDFNVEVSQYLLLVDLDEATHSIRRNSFLAHPEVDGLGLYAQPFGYLVCCDQAFLHFSRTATFATKSSDILIVYRRQFTTPNAPTLTRRNRIAPINFVS